jgi:predicted transcriptional regulator
MSIRPPYASAILAGTKQVEFRKRRLADDISRVVIYTTSPVQAVVGEFRVREQVTASPAELWRRYRSVAGIDRVSFFEYFSGTMEAVGIVIEGATRYERSQSLEEFEPGTRPPQSFKYMGGPKP